MKPVIFNVTNVGAGTLYVMPMPSAERLGEDIATFKKMGIHKVLSLLESEEATALGLARERAICLSNDIEFTSFPIKDRGLPDKAKLQAFLPVILRELKAGKTMTIHCRGGVGRTGILSCCLLIESGLSAADAIRLVSAARQRDIPDTDEQKAFIADY